VDDEDDNENEDEDEDDGDDDFPSLMVVNHPCLSSLSASEESKRYSSRETTFN
jgi:hypothetical protein